MTLGVKELSAKTENLSSSPRNQLVEAKTDFCPLFSDLCGWQEHTHMHTNTVV